MNTLHDRTETYKAASRIKIPTDVIHSILWKPWNDFLQWSFKWQVAQQQNSFGIFYIHDDYPASDAINDLIRPTIAKPKKGEF